MFRLSSNYHTSSFLQSQKYLWLRFAKISVRNKVQPESRRKVDLSLKVQSSLFRLSFEYEVRSLNAAKIQSHYTGKHLPFMNHSDLDLSKIDMFRYAGIPFIIMHQYQYVAQLDRLNNRTIRTCFRKGLCISMRDYKRTPAMVERKWRQVYFKLFEKWLYLTSAI